MTRAAVVALVLAAGAAHSARADAAPSPKSQPPIPAPLPSPPDRAAVDQASDANFDDDAPHHGFRIAVAAGGGFQLGGVPSSTGGGGGTSVRLGASASRRVALLFAIDLTKIAAKAPGSSLTDNTSSLLSLGPQVYLQEALWVRGGVGIASFIQKLPDEKTGNQLYAGPGATIGIGVDVAHWEHVAISLEANGVGAIYRSGMVVGGFVALGVGYR